MVGRKLGKNHIPLLATPSRQTPTSPSAAPAGTSTVMRVGLQLSTEQSTPETVTRSEAASETDSSDRQMRCRVRPTSRTAR